MLNYLRPLGLKPWQNKAIVLARLGVVPETTAPAVACRRPADRLLAMSFQGRLGYDSIPSRHVIGPKPGRAGSRAIFGEPAGSRAIAGNLRPEAGLGQAHCAPATATTKHPRGPQLTRR